MKKKISTKKKILEALSDDGIKGINDAIIYLSGFDMDIQEIEWKWEVTTINGEIFHFRDDEELVEWAREERDKIEEL